MRYWVHTEKHFKNVCYHLFSEISSTFHSILNNLCWWMDPAFAKCGGSSRLPVGYCSLFTQFCNISGEDLPCFSSRGSHFQCTVGWPTKNRTSLNRDLFREAETRNARWWHHTLSHCGCLTQWQSLSKECEDLPKYCIRIIQTAHTHPFIG